MLHLVEGQARSGLLTKLRRRATQLAERRRRQIAEGDETSVRTTSSGINYVSHRDLYYRADFHRNKYLPHLPYYRMDRDIPGVTNADRFRGSYHGYYSDYYRGAM